MTDVSIQQQLEGLSMEAIGGGGGGGHKHAYHETRVRGSLTNRTHLFHDEARLPNSTCLASHPSTNKIGDPGRADRPDHHELRGPHHGDFVAERQVRHASASQSAQHLQQRINAQLASWTHHHHHHHQSYAPPLFINQISAKSEAGSRRVGSGDEGGNTTYDVNLLLGRRDDPLLVIYARQMIEATR